MTAPGTFVCVPLCLLCHRPRSADDAGFAQAEADAVCGSLGYDWGSVYTLPTAGANTTAVRSCYGQAASVLLLSHTMRADSVLHATLAHSMVAFCAV